MVTCPSTTLHFSHIFREGSCLLQPGGFRGAQGQLDSHLRVRSLGGGTRTVTSVAGSDRRTTNTHCNQAHEASTVLSVCQALRIYLLTFGWCNLIPKGRIQVSLYQYGKHISLKVSTYIINKIEHKVTGP